MGPALPVPLVPLWPEVDPDGPVPCPAVEPLTVPLCPEVELVSLWLVPVVP
jgi:hypothetical protein